ncbi:hypothetical protein [Bradyrhizobium sp.]|nr:hypothetical protein [Bradyrhizobium sp.]MBV8699678.1 hypothetical protein [Bradyrhizobium sp.]MBV9979874.1 hypothetical protein [Bradyrhizobium sp.]
MGAVVTAGRAKGNRFVAGGAAPSRRWNSTGAIACLAPAHFLDQVFETG